MGRKLVHSGAVLALAVLFAQSAGAQSNVLILPTIDVSSRLGVGIVGSSTSVITAEEITRSTSQSLTEILSEQPGVQIQHVVAGVNGARDVVDLRGFGASATSNVLVLVNGRRFNDFDLQGFDFSSIPIGSIERIEITRGNSGAVLYGDGAVGGVINIVTKNGVGQPPSGRIEGAFGSFRYKEGRAFASGSFGPWSAALSGIGLNTDGFRENSQLRQKGLTGDFRYTGENGSAYFNAGADNQKLGLPGGRLVTPTSSELDSNPRGAATPNDFANKQGQNYVLGVTRMLAPGAELIVDGSFRQKKQQAELFFMGSPFNGVDTKLTTRSITPRLRIDTVAMGMPVKILSGFDYYHTAYLSNRAKDLISPPFHMYDIKQTTAGGYANGTVAVRPDTDVTIGARYQRNTLSARDTYDPTAPFGFGDAQGIPLDRSEWQYAAQTGFEHRFGPAFAVFGHVAHSFRVPNADERIGQAVSFNFPTPTPTNFDLRTQTSNEIEGGFRARVGMLDWQTSVYGMELKDEIFFSPATGTNINLDPTRHYGVENSAVFRLTDTVRLKGGLTYTRAIFREGPFAGNDIPLVSRWTGSAGVSWNIWDKWVVYDAIVRYVGERRLDNDSANLQPLIPAHAILDMRIGGEMKNAFWSFSVQNVFDTFYWDYGVASTTTIGRYNAYPQPGRTFMARLGFILP
jgi:iron complex outermembrane receptor protein